MKPPPFELHRPTSVEEVLSLLAEHGDDAKVLAGGQSLIPLLNFRLARPEVLVDINRVTELDRISASPDGGISIGALTRQAAVEASELAVTRNPLLGDALRLVAHPQIRNRGTFGGSVAHADPAAELPVAIVATDATVSVRSRGGERRIPAGEFFVSHLTTVMADDELLVSVDLPAVPERCGTAFEEFARRSGDYALGGAAAVVALRSDGSCASAALALLGAGDVPIRAREAESAVVGRPIDAASAAEAARQAVRDTSPISNMHGDADYRRRVVEAMVERALLKAAGRAEARSS
ncbi:MAG: xanthine dehydrogenase family protein subunit M [Actinobacteria bacterium]|nr:xanthine dehydrogenase family protein subunit M [Actinomycetota bacterium]